jgi:hypothetical protein
LDGREEWSLVDCEPGTVATDCNSFEFDTNQTQLASSSEDFRKMLCNPLLLDDLLHRSPLDEKTCGSEFAKSALWFASARPLVESCDIEKELAGLRVGPSAASSSSGSVLAAAAAAADAFSMSEPVSVIGGSPQYEPAEDASAAPTAPALMTVSAEDYPVPANMLTMED